MLSKPSSAALIALFNFSALLQPVRAQTATSAALATMTTVGCFSSSGNLVFEKTYKYQTSGYCQPICVALGMPVLGLTKGSDCWCGALLPAANTQVDISDCNTPCYGYDKEDCGSQDNWTVWLTGISDVVGSVGNSSSASTSASSSSHPSSTPSAVVNLPDKQTSSASSVAMAVATTSSSGIAEATQAVMPVVTPAATVAAATTVLTVGGATVVKTIAVASTDSATSLATASSSVKQEHYSSKPNTAGIAAGVVVGIIVLAALIGASVIFFRRKSRRSDSTFHRRQNSADATLGGGRLIGTTSIIATPKKCHLNDSRLDPRVMVDKRQSGGSLFADNEDYSRRILRVANPDEI